MDLSLINPFEPQSNRLLAQGHGNYLKVYDWSPNDRKAIFCDFASNTVSTLWLIDVVSGEKTLLSPKTGTNTDYYDAPQFSKDGKGLYIITDRGSQVRRLAYLNLATRQFKYLSDHIKWDVEDLKLSPDGKTVAFITNEDGISRLHLLDAEAGKEKMVPSLPIGIIFDLKWHNNSVDLGFNLKSPHTPTDVYSLDTNTCKVEQWSKGIIGQIDVQNGARHIETALRRLQEGGRLVSIVGEGMSFERLTFTEWWQRIARLYNVRANFHLNGKEYGKYGTTFDVQIIVIDKTGATLGDNWQQQLNNIRWGAADTLEDALAALEDLAAPLFHSASNYVTEGGTGI